MTGRRSRPKVYKVPYWRAISRIPPDSWVDQRLERRAKQGYTGYTRSLLSKPEQQHLKVNNAGHDILPMMVGLVQSLAALLVAAAAPNIVLAERTFYNSGTLNGWDYVRREHQGTVTQVDNVSYKGGTALKMTQTYDANYHDRYHSEVDHNYGYKRGDTLFYGFAFRLSEAWEFQDQSYNIAQFIANRPGAGCGGDDWMPSAMIWVQGNQLTSRIVSGHYRQPDCSRKIDTLRNLATIQAGKWHRVVVQAKWASDSSGYYKIWLDGNKVFERLNVPTTVDDDSVFQYRVGLYANSWHDDGYMKGSQGFRQIWYDEVAIGTTFKDVDPDQQ